MTAEPAPQAGGAVAFFDLFDPDFPPDGPAVHAAREAGWYARTSLGYAGLRYAEAAALLRDRRRRQGGVESLAAQGVTEGPLADWMRAVVHELVDHGAAAGAGEFMAAVADPYPSRVMAALLGIPPARYAQFHAWTTDLGLAFGSAVAQDRPRIEAALAGLSTCVDALLAERRGAHRPAGVRGRRLRHRRGAAGPADVRGRRPPLPGGAPRPGGAVGK